MAYIGGLYRPTYSHLCDCTHIQSTTTNCNTKRSATRKVIKRQQIVLRKRKKNCKTANVIAVLPISTKEESLYTKDDERLPFYAFFCGLPCQKGE